MLVAQSIHVTPAVPDAPPAREHSLGYIGEIDGLRAVAVLSVLFYHAGFPWMPGGFVGVDVFFVISGYLITRILLELLETKSVLPVFYQRRILRIAPALSTTLLATALAFFVLFPPTMSLDFADSLVAATLSYANLWFYSTVDYFARDSVQPVLHTWSLAVEEQFYLVLPLLLLALRRWGLRKLVVPVFAAMFALSLLAAMRIVSDSPSQAFYFPWLRAWELLAGSLLAAVDLRPIPRGLRHLLSAAGLAAIAFACLRYRSSMTFPGAAALLPVLGTAAVIAGAGMRNPINAFLQLRPMRWIGRISYSLYLVHWPIVAVAGLLVNVHANRVRLAIVLASIAVGWASWRWVERPLRALADRASPRQVFAGLAATVIVLLLSFAGLREMGTLLWERSPTALRHASFEKADRTFFRLGTCFLSTKYQDLKPFDQPACTGAGRPGVPSVLVLGDSHAANIAIPLRDLHPGLNVLQATAAGCKPTMDAQPSGFCGELVRFALDQWLPRHGAEVQHVIIAARWAAADIAPLQRTVQHLQALGKRVIIYGPSPEYTLSVPLMLAYEEITGLDLRRRMFIEERRALDARFRAAFSRSAVYFSTFETLCGTADCAVIGTGRPLLFDRDHYTYEGSMRALRGFPLP